MSDSRGSALIHLIAAGTFLRTGHRRSKNFWFSAVVPAQTFLGQPPAQDFGANFVMRDVRLVRSSQSSIGVFSMSGQKRSRALATSGWSSKTSAMLEQKTFRRTPDFSAARFQRMGSFQ